MLEFCLGMKEYDDIESGRTKRYAEQQQQQSIG